jgi:HK97 family phage prohead protease
MHTLVERRAAQLEVRARGRRLEGYAAVFNTEARIADFVETIAPGAFAASLRSGDDILALVDHDPTKLLARTKSGSLQLSEDGKGLAFALDTPSTTAGEDVLELVHRGDIGGMSFGFTVHDFGERWDGNKRELRDVTLHEISVVSSWPAYPQTSVTARAKWTKDFRTALARRYLELVK